MSTRKPLGIKRLQVDKTQAGIDLQSFVATSLDCSRRKAKDMIDSKRIRVNDRPIWMAKHRLRPGDLVAIPALTETKKPGKAKIQVLHEDQWLLAVNKPAGLVVDKQKECLEDILRNERGENRISALHRLDRGTTGALLFSRKPEHRETYVDLFREQQIEKTYLALVRGSLPRAGVTVDRALDGKTATSHFQPLDGCGQYLLVECRIPTGRTHQIRRHLLEEDCQVVGDREYVLPRQAPDRELNVRWPLLHALRLEFPCPHSGHPLTIEAPPTEGFLRFMQEAGLKL